MAGTADNRPRETATADGAAGAAALLVVVPLFRSPELLPELFAALTATADELAELGGRVILINDSPDHQPLADALEQHLPALRGMLEVELWTNDRNLGFVRTANRALAHARDTGADIILLNSDARPRPGAFREMAAVARLDPMIGFVSPRSDHGTLCNSPAKDEYRDGLGPERAYANHLAIVNHLPRLTYVPTAVGFCLYIRNLMLREFGLFDEIYGVGYNEENDLIRRCNQCGYRAVLANHAYVHHIGGVSFDQTDIAAKSNDYRNHDLLISRYPEYDRIVDRFFRSAEYRAQYRLAGLIPDDDGRIRILLDCRVLLCHHNGTQEHLRCLLSAFAREHSDRYAPYVLCGADAFAYHGLDRMPGLIFCDEELLRRRAFAVAMRLGQAFNPDDMLFVSTMAPITGFLMLDTIAMDCQQLDEHDLSTLWQHMYDLVDLVGYNSGFTRDQFHRRFDVPDRIVEFDSMCSTDVEEYLTLEDSGYAPVPDDSAETGGILLMGNHYPHKSVRPMLEAIREAGAERIVVLGVEVEADAATVSHRAGLIPQEVVDRLYAEAGLLLFPSHYEGFGLPILHAVARHTPVVARDLPVTREIRDRLAGGANIHLGATSADLVELAMAAPEWQAPTPGTNTPPQTWTAAADALGEALDEAIARFDFRVCQRQQLRAAALRGQLDAKRRAAESDECRRRTEEARARAEQRAADCQRQLDGLEPAHLHDPLPADADQLCDAAVLGSEPRPPRLRGLVARLTTRFS